MRFFTLMALVSSLVSASAFAATGNGSLSLQEFHALLAQSNFPSECSLVRNDLKNQLVIEISKGSDNLGVVLDEALSWQAVGVAASPQVRVYAQTLDGSGSFGDVFSRQFVEVFFDQSQKRISSLTLSVVTGAGTSSSVRTITCRENANEASRRDQCIQSCLNDNERPSWELKACVSRCKAL